MKSAKWKIGLLMAVGVWMVASAGTAYGATAESEPFRLSLKADGVRDSAGNETLAYSSLWAGSGAGTTTLRQDGETLVEGLEGEGDWAWAVERNGTYVLTHTIYEGGDAVGEETATFTVSGWEVPFPEGDVGVAAWEGKYDGTGHGVTVSVAEELEGVSVHYATSESGPWRTEPPLFTNACTPQTVWCEFSGRDYITQTNSATVTVLPREVTLTSADASKRYDGEALTAHGVTVGGDGFVEGEGAEYEWTGAQMTTGMSENTFTYTLRAGTEAGNYGISTAFGTLTVEKGLQTIDFAEIGKQVTTNTVTLAATASSGLVVGYAVEGPGVLAGNMLSFTGTGLVTVTASQSGDANWEAAANVVRSFEVARAITPDVVWYVDAENGSDSADGFSWETAKKTIQAAVSLAIDGNTVIVTNGVYGAIATDNKAVAIRSVNGAGCTVIDGKGSERCFTAGNAEYDLTTGFTPRGTNSLLCGFTLQNGVSSGSRFGGGSLGGTLERCVIKANSAAEQGGGAYGGLLRNCLVIGNASVSGGGGAAKAKLVNCTVAGNTSRIRIGGVYQGQIDNCIVAGNEGTQVSAEANSSYSASDWAAVKFMDADNGDFRLSVASPCIDGGDSALAPDGGDLDGNPRVVGRSVDMGCFEKQDVSIAGDDVSVTLETADAIYDATAHEPAVTVTVEGAQLTKERDFSVVYEANVDAGTARAITTGCGIFSGTVTNFFAIGPRSVTLTSESAVKTYDGVALTNHAVIVGGDGFVGSEGVTCTVYGSQTDAGVGENAFSYTLREGTKEGNYAISTVFGTLTVEKASAGGEDGEEPGGGEVPEGGLSVFDTTAVYDGEEHTIDTNALVEVFAEALIGDFTVEYAAAEEEPSAEWVADAPLFTNVCSATVWYRVSSPNYEDFVHAARVTITARPVEVRVSGATGTFGYDGEEKSVEGYALETEDELFDVHGMTRFGGTAVAQRTDAGRTAMGLDAVEFSCTDANFDATYVVLEDGWVEVTAADISDGEEGAFVVTLGANPMYDGTEKSVEVESATWKGLPMTFEVEGNTAVDAGSYRLTVTGTGNFAGTQTAEWAVLRRAVTLTSADASKEYDATALTAQEVTVGGDGWAEGEGAEYAWTGTQTDVGMSENVFTYTLRDGTKAGNYDITTAFGTLEVTAANISDGEEGAFVVTLGANPMYDGTEKRVEVESATWKGLLMTFEVAGNTAVDAGSYRLTVTGTGNFAGTQTAEWAVLRRAVTLTSADASKEYDATALTAQEVTVGSDGWAQGEGAEYAWTGTQTDVGTSENAFTYTLHDGTKAENYDITTAFGTLEVTKGSQTIDFPAIGTQAVTNTVLLGATASSGLPVNYEVTSGPGLLEGNTLSFTWVGSVTVTASQPGDGNWESAEPVSIEVEVTGLLTLTVECANGTAEPSVGAHEILLGTPVEATASGSPEVLGEGLRAVCTGWRLDGNDPETGAGMVARFTLTNSATLTWLWETQALVEAEALAHGTTEGSGWYALGSQTALRAVPNAGHPFTGWMGDVPGGSSSANPLEMTVTGPGRVVATFFTTYYASEDGNDAASGLSWATTKREIASALAESAWGDTVVAASGTYRPIAVPESVTVRSLSGPEKTRIAGGAGTRCVEAASGALVEGFALEGGETDGDGGGALLATGAELHRCILRGNRAGGTGGGAKGGVLENCLVIGNTASSGGGASGAELRHCTVVRNAGGGARDCRTVNSIFWENDGGDVSGGTTTWSLCNPIVAGSGNIDGEPLFAGENDWRLLYDSPCLDAATDSAVQEDLTGAPRPQPRVYGEALKPDMGCYEYVPKARFVWEKGSATPPYESWADAARDIQSALDISGGGDRIVVEAGTYAPVTVSNAVILMGYRGPERTVIDGGSAERAVTMTGGGLLTGFTVRGGVSEDCGGILADGGATVRDVVVENCRATGAEGVGGGLCLYGGSVAENVTASGNTAAVGAGVYATATSAVKRCTLADNAATARGGGAYLEDGSRLSWSVLHGNSAALGGGACGEDCEIADSEMSANMASESGGAAAVVGSTFRNNRLVGNRASASGGGLFAQDTDGHDCLVVSNAAPQGAGVWMEGAGQLWNFTVADNAGPGAGVAARGRTLLGNTIAWGNAGGNLDAEVGTEVRHSCVQPVPAGEGNFADAPAFVGNGDYHIRAGSPCVDAGENQPWMPEASDFEGQRRVETGTEGDGRDIWVDVGADEAAQDAILAPAPGAPFWTWRVVMDARLQLQSAVTLMDGAAWQDSGEPFTATEQTWTLDEPFDGTGKRFYRLIWIRDH